MNEKQRGSNSLLHHYRITHMTGIELKKMMKMAGVTSPELAKLLGWKTPFRIYAARQDERGSVRVVIDRALEKFMSTKHYNRALDEIRAMANPENVERVTFEKGVKLTKQEKKDLVSIAVKVKAKIHLTKDQSTRLIVRGTQLADTFQVGVKPSNNEFSNVS